MGIHVFFISIAEILLNWRLILGLLDWDLTSLMSDLAIFGVNKLAGLLPQFEQIFCQFERNVYSEKQNFIFSQTTIRIIVWDWGSKAHSTNFNSYRLPCKKSIQWRPIVTVLQYNNDYCILLLLHCFIHLLFYCLIKQ